MTRLSVIMPVLDEADAIEVHLRQLADLRRRGAEIIVVDGGSTDGTATLAEPLADRLLAGERGRARQMNRGAAAASGDILLFLHADTILPENADRIIVEALGRGRADWGRFDVTLDGRHPLLPIVARLMNARSRLTGIATGDQAIFVRRALFETLGGFAPIELMEDIELSARLKRRGAPACLRERVSTSARRWESKGVGRTILLMWRLRFAYWRGADPKRLADAYRNG